MPAQHRALLVAKFPEPEKPFAHRGNVRLVMRDRLAKSDRDWIRNLARPFHEIPPAFKRKDGAPKLIHPHRHHGAFRCARDQFVTALQPQQHARAREFALRENADDFTLAHECRRLFHRVFCALRGDGKRTDGPEDRIEKPLFVDVLEDDEPDRARTRELEHDGIDPGQMIRKKQEAARGQTILEMGGDAVDQPGKRGTEETKQSLLATWSCGRHARTLQKSRRTSHPKSVGRRAKG